MSYYQIREDSMKRLLKSGDELRQRMQQHPLFPLLQADPQVMAFINSYTDVAMQCLEQDDPGHETKN